MAKSVQFWFAPGLVVLWATKKRRSFWERRFVLIGVDREEDDLCFAGLAATYSPAS
jgi:hypothetical protein